MDGCVLTAICLSQDHPKTCQQPKPWPKSLWLSLPRAPTNLFFQHEPFYKKSSAVVFSDSNQRQKRRAYFVREISNLLTEAKKRSVDTST